MYLPDLYRLLLPAFMIPSPQSANKPTGELVHDTPVQVPSAWGCPSMTVRCVKDGNWPNGIVGDIGKKDFCWEWPRCNQCDIRANTDECNLTFPECEDACDAFAPIPF
ncbi:unnamed protein product [Rhizoctonia solani]|uniref:Uncharacterized protein n=1 Tax=Rhizoctonia solani TaxID=456999 RepID=A0A8H2ZZQ8_9AGAM|nr:unnamed protein product [Rhizoctonia solani]